MVWMPVSEAAASLGVSERTIWRRIKSQSIETRSEGGRTLVGLEPPRTGDPVRELSHVAAAQLSMRKLDADNLCDVLSVLADYRGTFDEQIRRSRRALRWTVALIGLLVVSLGAAGWYHFRELARIEREQATVIADLRADLEHQLGAATSLATARTEETENMRSIERGLREQLSAVESSRREHQVSARKRFSALEETIAGQSSVIHDRDQRVSELRTRVDSLTQSLANIERAREALHRQRDRVMDAFRIDTARSRGLAEGLRIHAEQQRRMIAALQQQIENNGTADLLADAPNADRATREALWASVVRPTGRLADSPVDASWNWSTLFREWFVAWITGGEDADELAVTAMAN